MRRPGGLGRVCLVLLTDLIIPRGGKLLCQLLRNYIWIVLIELDGFSEWQGLDTAILPGKSQKEFSIHAIALALEPV
jgi:hypothetical protein